MSIRYSQARAKLETPTEVAPKSASSSSTHTAHAARTSNQSLFGLPSNICCMRVFPYKCSHVENRVKMTLRMTLRALRPALRMCGNDPFPCTQHLLIGPKLESFRQ